jgi:type I restriction enzyme, S subunit
MNKEKLIPELRFPEFENEGEWDLKEFSNFIKLDRGSSPRPIQEYLTQDVSGVNWIKIGDTKNAVNSVIYQVEEKITSKGAEKSRRVEIGELILANSMSFGKTYELAIEGCIYDGWFVLRKYDKYFVKPFLLQLLNSDFMQNQYKRLSAGGIVQNISSDIVYNSKLFHTSLLEQQKITSCLSSLDEVITAHSQKLDLLKDHKKGLMQNLFPQEGEKVPKYRFKEFENDGEWKEDILFNLALDGFSNGVFNDPKKVGSGYKLINVINMYSESPISENNLTLLELNDSEFEKNKVKYGDIFFTRSSLVPEGIAKSNIYLGSSDDITYDGHLIRMRPNKELIYPVYLHYLLKTENVRSQMIAKGKTATMTTIGQSDVASVKTSYSKNPKEQQKIASCLSSLDALITAQAEKIEQLKLHKKGLMQGLFPKIND